MNTATRSERAVKDTIAALYRMADKIEADARDLRELAKAAEQQQADLDYQPGTFRGSAFGENVSSTVMAAFNTSSYVSTAQAAMRSAHKACEAPTDDDDL
jgi:hypothetical protein